MCPSIPNCMWGPLKGFICFTLLSDSSTAFVCTVLLFYVKSPLCPSLSTPSLNFFCWCRQTEFLMSKGISITLGQSSATLDNYVISFKFIPTCGEHADQG